LKVPQSLREEHEAFIEGLKSYSTGNGETASAVRELLGLLEPHIEKENEFVLPLLGVLRGLAAGKPVENPRAVMRAYEKCARQYVNMFAEHSPIRQSIKETRRLAKEQGQDGVVDILDALAHHSRVEEEVLYPAALLVGTLVAFVGLTRRRDTERVKVPSQSQQPIKGSGSRTGRRGLESGSLMGSE